MSRRLMSQMNVVPYIDVMLVLLIIFMVTSQLTKPKVSEKVREEIRRSRQELIEQKTALAKVRDELNVIEMLKDQKLQYLGSIKKNTAIEQTRLAEVNNEMRMKKDQIANLKSELDQTKASLSEFGESRKIYSEIKNYREKLAEQELTIARMRDEFNATKVVKDQELESLKREKQVERARLIEMIDQQNGEIEAKERQNVTLESKYGDLLQQLERAKIDLSETEEEVRRLREEINNRISVAKSIKMCNERNYTMDVALTYGKLTKGYSSAIVYSEGWYNLSPGECETVRIEDAVGSDVLLYERNGQQRLGREKFCMDMNKAFAIQNSDNQYSCKGQMIPIELMVRSCVVGDGQVNFIQ